MNPELGPRPNRPPDLPLPNNSLVICKHAVKDSAILKSEDTFAMLLFQLPLSLIAATCGVVQRAISVPLSISELAFIPAET